ncbi:MAG: tripartite tricarboxylate transporter substrate binding protein, partial [Betaproteobacteria bacterium]|nr:tripartite tricarboxylate transporter substrate binding protein [Betaproteobacteria bacterium]
DLVAGQIAFLMDSVVSAQTHIRDGKVKPLAVTGTRRSESLPQVPTFAEVGIEGMNISNWFGMLGPAAMPAEIAARMNREVNAALKAPEVIERLTRAGAEPVGGTPDAFKSIIRTEYDNWKALIARAGIKPESGS